MELHTRTPRVGSLLVASPELVDPNFDSTVILLLEVGEDGALGVVLNRPSVVAVDEVLAVWADRVDEPEVLFQGGPVGTDGALAVGVQNSAHDNDMLGFRPVGTDAMPGLGLVDLDIPLELVECDLVGLRIFAGYAGWSLDQLEAEIAEGSWYVVPALLSDVFSADHTTLWSEVMRRQPGQLAWHATRPVDPGMN